jgi:hypothetical protein
MQVGGVVQRGGIYLSPDEDEPIRIDVVDKRSDPRQASEMERLLKEGVHEIHLNVNSRYVVIRSVVALVRAAYLLMFRAFGYRYLFDPSAQVVRDQIASPLDETDVLKGVAWRFVHPSVPSETALAIATAPDKRNSFMALLRLDQDPDHMAAVTLPPPGADGAEFFRTMAASGAERTYGLSILPMWGGPGFIPLAELWHHVENGGLA